MNGKGKTSSPTFDVANNLSSLVVNLYKHAYLTVYTFISDKNIIISYMFLSLTDK